MNFYKQLSGLFQKLIILCLMIMFSVIAINVWIFQSAKSYVFTNPDDLPVNDIGLVLAARVRIRGGRISPYFVGRNEAAAKLYHAGKVKKLLLSGESRANGYNEPAEMKASLLKLGVPESAMTLDSSCKRTLDSIVRAREVFGLNRLTIITDDFHTSRALFLSRYYGIDAVAFSSARIPLETSMGNRAREWLARVKAVLDVYILHTRPEASGSFKPAMLNPNIKSTQ
jgi:SanA protein